MSDKAISVTKLGKWFETTRRSTGIREAIVSSLQPVRKRRQIHGFWALEDVSFTVNKGEIVGIVGHNGAGKSVLLKILAGITNPTLGRAEIRGRIGALLELGTGFHPELSGYDNIYLNGSLLGMRPWEIDEKFEEIISFSGIRSSMEEAVKHYSSGMMMRLAFSIAANLAPEVIFLDEVWAVGDIEFQKRAFAKMRQLISSGRTVVIVSHSLDTIAHICSTCILLEHGHVKDVGNARKVVQSYISSTLHTSTVVPNIEVSPETSGGTTPKDGGVLFSPPGSWCWADRSAAPGSDRLILRSAKLMNSQGISADSFIVGEPITVEITYEQSASEGSFVFGLAIQDLHGSLILANQSPDIPFALDASNPVLSRRARCILPGRMSSGSYKIVLVAGRTAVFTNPPDFVLQDVLSFAVLPEEMKACYTVDVSRAGSIDAEWTVELLDAPSSLP